MMSLQLEGNNKIQWIFVPHFFIERLQAGDEVLNKHQTFSNRRYKRRGILSGMLKTHKLTRKIGKIDLTNKLALYGNGFTSRLNYVQMII